MAQKNKNPSQNQNHPPEASKDRVINNSSLGPWTFGYPQCINKKESRLVCLHKECEKYPFFCSACEDESCQKQHQHKDRITSIGFKELVRRLVTERNPPDDLQRSVTSYKEQLQRLLISVTEFVEKQSASMDEVLKKSCEVQGEDAIVVQRLKDKKYQQIKGKDLDSVWKKIAPNQHKKKIEKEMVEFIDSKRIEVEQMTNNFKDGATTQNDLQNTRNIHTQTIEKIQSLQKNKGQ